MAVYRKLCSLYVTCTTLEVTGFCVCISFRIWDLDFSQLPLRIPSICILEDFYVVFFLFLFFLLGILLMLLLFSAHVCYSTTEFQQITSLPSCIDISQSLTNILYLYIIQHKKGLAELCSYNHYFSSVLLYTNSSCSWVLC